VYSFPAVVLSKTAIQPWAKQSRLPGFFPTTVFSFRNWNLIEIQQFIKTIDNQAVAS
jgi:hypothetical protein